MKITKWYSFVLFLFIILNIKAQNFEIGYEIGLGHGGIYHPETGLKALSFTDDPRLIYYRAGLSTYFLPGSLSISIKSGLTYNQLTSGYFHDLRIIQLPVGVDVLLGKKKYVDVGGGFYVNCLINKKRLDIIYRDYQAGLYANIGLLLPVSNKLSVDVKALYGYDLTKINTDESASLYGGTFNTDTYCTNIFMVMSLRYKLIPADKTGN